MNRELVYNGPSRQCPLAPENEVARPMGQATAVHAVHAVTPPAFIQVTAVSMPPIPEYGEVGHMSGGGACWEGDHCEGSLRGRPGGAWHTSSDQGDLHDGIAVMKYIENFGPAGRGAPTLLLETMSIHTWSGTGTIPYVWTDLRAFHQV